MSKLDDLSVEDIIMYYIAAQCRLRNDLYMGVDLWPIFVAFRSRYNIPENKRTVTQRNFADKHVVIYHSLTEDDARKIVYPSYTTMA